MVGVDAKNRSVPLALRGGAKVGTYFSRSRVSTTCTAGPLALEEDCSRLKLASKRWMGRSRRGASLLRARTSERHRWSSGDWRNLYGTEVGQKLVAV